MGSSANSQIPGVRYASAVGFSVGDCVHTSGLNHHGGKASQAPDIPRAMAFAYPAAVSLIVPIDNLTTAVFDAPVTAAGNKRVLRVGLLRSWAGNAIDNTEPKRSALKPFALDSSSTLWYVCRAHFWDNYLKSFGSKEHRDLLPGFDARS